MIEPTKIDVTKCIVSDLFDKRSLIKSQWLIDKWKLNIERFSYVDGLKPATDFYGISVNGKEVFGSEDLKQIEDYVLKFANHHYWFDLFVDNAQLKNYGHFD